MALCRSRLTAVAVARARGAALHRAPARAFSSVLRLRTTVWPLIDARVRTPPLSPAPSHPTPTPATATATATAAATAAPPSPAPEASGVAFGVALSETQSEARAAALALAAADRAALAKPPPVLAFNPSQHTRTLSNRAFAAGFKFHTQCAAAAHFPTTLPPEVALAGRSNAGKSSLLNALCASAKSYARDQSQATDLTRLARVSKTPGRTQLITYFTAKPLTLVDLPGTAPTYLISSLRVVRSVLPSSPAAALVVQATGLLK
jgi:hypothetical protein